MSSVFSASGRFFVSLFVTSAKAWHMLISKTLMLCTKIGSNLSDPNSTVHPVCDIGLCTDNCVSNVAAFETLHGTCALDKEFELPSHTPCGPKSPCIHSNKTLKHVVTVFRSLCSQEDLSLRLEIHPVYKQYCWHMVRSINTHC